MLSRKLSKPRNNEKGFTLIELIIVIVILGIIAGVAIPRFVGLSDDARKSAARGVAGAMSGTIAAQHANFLLDATAYTAATVVGNTTFASGIASPDASAAPAITWTSGPNVYRWTYNPNVGDTSAFFTETSDANWTK